MTGNPRFSRTRRGTPSIPRPARPLRLRDFPLTACPFERTVLGNSPSLQILNDPESPYYACPLPELVRHHVIDLAGLSQRTSRRDSHPVVGSHSRRRRRRIRDGRRVPLGRCYDSGHTTKRVIVPRNFSNCGASLDDTAMTTTPRSSVAKRIALPMVTAS